MSASDDLYANGFFVKLSPYIEVIGDAGLLYDRRRTEIGYKFQLFLSGVPFGGGQTVPVHVLSKNPVGQEVTEAVASVERLIEKLASLHTGIHADCK